MSLKDLIIDYTKNEEDILKWTTLKGEYRYHKMINFMKDNNISLTWSNITNYMKYDKRILYNCFKYIVILEEFFKSMIAKNSSYSEEDLLNMGFTRSLTELTSLNAKLEFEDIDFELIKKEMEPIISFRNAIAHNKMLHGRIYFQKRRENAKTLNEILDIYRRIIPLSYRSHFVDDIYNCQEGLGIKEEFVYFKELKIE